MAVHANGRAPGLYSPDLDLVEPGEYVGVEVDVVAGSGGSPLSVFRGSAVTSASPMERGLPGLRSSYRPMSPCVRKRSRHLPTVRRLARTLSATFLLLIPSAHGSTISARLTSPAGRLREPASDSSSSRVHRRSNAGGGGYPRAANRRRRARPAAGRSHALHRWPDPPERPTHALGPRADSAVRIQTSPNVVGTTATAGR